MAGQADEDPEGYESFSVDDADLQYALNPGQWRRQTKEQATYGMWAAHEDSDDDTPASGRRSKKYGGGKQSLSTPVSFISGGFKKTAKEEAADAEQDDDDEAVDIRPSKASVRSGTGSASGSGWRSKASSSGHGKQDVFAGMRSMGPTGKDFGDWERHTRGIGLKLLQKMGYEKGKGLGSGGTGIVEPVVAAKRSGRGAVGAYGAEVKGPKRPGYDDSTLDKGANNDEDQDESGGASTKAIGQWRKGKKSGKQYRYRTIEDVINEGGTVSKRADMVASGVTTAHNQTKIIDMTGREQKVYTGYHALKVKDASKMEDDNQDLADLTKQASKFDVPELRHNLNMLLEMTEEEIIRNDRQIKHLTDQKISLEYECKEMKTRLNSEETQKEKMRTVIQMVQRFSERQNSGSPMSLAECRDFFEQLIGDHYEEYKLFELNNLVVAVVVPQLKRKFSEWEPWHDADDEFGLDEMRSWRALVEQPGASRQTTISLNHMDVYHRMLWQAWLPRVRLAVNDHWKPQDDSQWLIQLVDKWTPLLPLWMVENLLDKIILPRIEKEVDDWNPQTALVPIHLWLHPWLPLMGDRLQPVYAPIRQKLGRAMQHWHPSDNSAKMVLKPWINVFTKGTLDAFLAQHIVPKLEREMLAMNVNPANQQLDAFNWLLGWMDMINVDVIANVLLNTFFVKWQQTLYRWLCSPTCNFEEVSQWYQSWKALFPMELRAVNTIQMQFQLALEQMNRAISGVPPRPPPGCATPVPVQPQPTRPIFDGSSAPSSFKDLVESRARDLGVAFMPVPNKKPRNDKIIYWFGPHQIYIDRDVIFVDKKRSGLWDPIGLNDLVQLTIRSS